MKIPQELINKPDGVTVQDDPEEPDGYQMDCHEEIRIMELPDPFLPRS
jgi:hypothetical protein